jgi:peptidoglycan/xylan/chitin deacetylase (PgdA/CDA1 family)
MYHRVLSEEETYHSPSQDGIVVKTKTFRKQMEYVVKHLKPISMRDFANHLKKNSPFPHKTCLITFDDGWRDNFLNAYPILKEKRLPSIIFLPTDFIGTNRRFWQEEVTVLLLTIRNYIHKDQIFGTKVMNAPVHTEIKNVILSNDENLPQNITGVLTDLKKNSHTEIEHLIHSLKDILPGEQLYVDNQPVFLNWDEIKTMAGNNVAFGAHGKSHILLPILSNEDILQQLSESKEETEKHLNQPVCAFSYPNGDYNKDVLKAVQDQGYTVAFGTENGFVSHLDDPFRVKRINIHEDMTDTIPMFLCRIAGIW